MFYSLITIATLVNYTCKSFVKVNPGAPNRSRTYELLGTCPNALPVISHKRLKEAKDIIILKYSPGFKFNPLRFYRCVKVQYFLE